MSGYVSARFDFARQEAVSKVLVVASSYRSGSTYVSLSLWRDGRFGAPFEYFNFEKHMDYMMARLNANHIDDYIEKLIPIRTSKNGAFAVKAHFHHFEFVVKKSATWQRYLPAAKFLYIHRNDKLAQAVSMAKALQNNAFTSLGTARRVPLFYSRELIEDCLQEVMAQSEGWWRWFETAKVEPYVINYEDFLRGEKEHIERIASWFGVDRAVPDVVRLPMIERQSDHVNREWIERYLAERDHGSATRSLGSHPPDAERHPDHGPSS
jgi:LPS sulfotransferase NodH